MTDSTGSPSGGGGMGAEELFDLTIIGGGPVGLFAAFYAGLRQMKTKIIDSLEELGGQLTTLYPEKFIFDVAGFPKVLARDLAHQLIQQAMQANPAVALGETVRHLEPLGDADNPRYRIMSDKGSHLTRTLMICAGAGAFSPKKLRIPEAPGLENRGLFYACRSKAAFAGKRVLIVGGGDSAVDWSLNLRDTAESITLIHRRNQFRAHEESVRQLQATDVKILTFFEIKSLVGGGGGEQGLTAAVIENSQTKEVRTLEVDAVLVQIGFDTSLGPIKEWPLKVERGQIQVNSHMETALPGVFAAGDVAAYEGKLKLIATGFGEAAMAVNFAKVRVDPKAKFFPGHSSEMTAQHESVVTV